jgi:hypothetical protein
LNKDLNRPKFLLGGGDSAEYRKKCRNWDKQQFPNERKALPVCIEHDESSDPEQFGKMRSKFADGIIGTYSAKGD